VDFVSRRSHIFRSSECCYLFAEINKSSFYYTDLVDLQKNELIDAFGIASGSYRDNDVNVSSNEIQSTLRMVAFLVCGSFDGLIISGRKAKFQYFVIEQ
jgi:hypothetical protein